MLNLYYSYLHLISLIFSKNTYYAYFYFSLELEVLSISTNHGRNCEIPRMHALGKPVHLASCVAEYDSLCDTKGIIQITKGFQFPVLFFNKNKELPNT